MKGIRRLLVEPLPTEAEASRLVAEEELRAARDFAPVRRREYLGWRALLCRELGPVTVRYTATGAPCIAERPDLFLGVSHGAGRVALCLSDSPCAVDVERLDRPFARIADHYLTPDEQALCGGQTLRLAAAWCAKETLWKLDGGGGLDLCRDLRLLSIGDEEVVGTICGGVPLRLALRRLEEDAVVVWYL